MRILSLIAALAICSFANFSVQSYEDALQNPSQSTPKVIFSNNTQNSINGFIAYYYFTSAEPNPVFEPYYLAGGNGSIEHISGVNYRVKLDFSSVSIPTGSIFPNNSGISFGLHYANWANWVKNDDYSNNMSQTIANNNSIVVTNLSGMMLAGIHPNFNTINVPAQPGNVMARVYVLKEGESNFAKIRLYVKNEGKIALSHFDFTVEVTAENGQKPIFNAWYMPNTTYSMEQKNDSVWAIHFSVKNVSLEPGSIFPNYDGISFGINYSNWSNVNTQNDYALKDLQNQYSLANEIPLYINGKLVSGNPKIHNIADIKKIIVDESEFTMSDFNRSVESLLADIPERDIEDFWDNTEILFENVPNYDSTQQAVGQIFAKFPGLDTLTFVAMWKDVKDVYEQLVRLRIYKRYAISVAPAKEMLLMKATNSIYDTIRDVIRDTIYDYYDEKYCGYYGNKGYWADFSKIKILIKNPLRIKGTERAKNFAEAWTAEYVTYKGLPTNYQNRADGFRHAVLSALLCREVGEAFDNVGECLRWSERLTNEHEKNVNERCNDELDRSMDLHNNAIGRNKYEPHLSVGCEWVIIISLGGYRYNWCVNEEVVGPSREETKQMFFKIANDGIAFNEMSQLSRQPWRDTLVFYRADNDKLYCTDKNTEKDDNCETFNSPETKPVKIGVLKKNPAVCKDEFTFYLDLEDSNNNSKIISGDENPPGIKITGGGVRFTYCTLDIDGEHGSIPKVPYDYVVLRLSDGCPAGTFMFRRYHDNEDSKNNNSYSGDIGPNEISRNAILEYCLVPADENSDLEFPFGDDYGIFANVSSETLIHSEIKLDDEDSNNSNSWYWYSNWHIKDRVSKIMNGSSNTIYHAVSYIVIVWNAIVDFFFG